MVEIKIDGKICDCGKADKFEIGYATDTLTDLEKGRKGRTIEFKIPLNANNALIFGISGDVHSQSRFNSEWHQMTIEADGITLFTGTAYLMQVVWFDNQRYVIVECRGGVIGWAERAARTLVKDIEIEYQNRLNESTIKASWSDDSPVKFFPIVRDRYTQEGSSVDVSGVRLVRSIDDYHPFIQLSALLEAIFAMSGYTVESSTATAENFDELYISGNYESSSNNAAIKQAMGFYLKRLSDTTTTTDSLGRVSMSPYDSLTTIGNIVDLETAAQDIECYNNGNCMQLDGEAVMFKPLTQIHVGFEYYLHYTCQCTIGSRQLLKGIDRLNTIEGEYISWEIPNRHIDQRDNIYSGLSYKMIIFDLEDGDVYRLVGVTEAGKYVVVKESITTRASVVEFDQRFERLILYRMVGGAPTPYGSDWALYFGYVDESAPVEVKITFRTAPNLCSPTTPASFETMLLEGAAPGVEFTIHKDSSLRPYFSKYPSYNSILTFEDLAQHRSVSALDILRSVQHLFNLRFLTNESAKSVAIESFDNFYNGFVTNWSDKVTEHAEIEFIDLAHSTNRTTTYGYQQTDGVVKRLGESDNIYFGEWSVDVDSYAASGTERSVINPVLSASTNDEDGVVVVGDRDDIDMIDSLSFSPRIVRYFGMIDIPDENSEIPYIAFHSPEDDFTLCFEDRDGVDGLNRLYLEEVNLRRRAQVIQLSLKLTAIEYSNLLEPNGVTASIRSLFIFDLKGERFTTILQSIDGYDPHTGVARCSFLNLD